MSEKTWLPPHKVERKQQHVDTEDTSKRTQPLILSIPEYDTKDIYAVMLLSSETFVNMRKAACARRELENESDKIKGKRVVAQKFRQSIENRIDDLSKSKAAMKDRVQDCRGEDDCVEALPAIMEQLDRLHTLWESVDQELRDLAASLMRHVSVSLRAQGEANSYIDAAFVHSDVLPPWQPSSHESIKDRDIDEEIRKLGPTKFAVVSDSDEDNASSGGREDWTSQLDVRKDRQQGHRKSQQTHLSPANQPLNVRDQTHHSYLVPDHASRTTASGTLPLRSGLTSNTGVAMCDDAARADLCAAFEAAKAHMRRARVLFDARDHTRELETQMNEDTMLQSRGLEGVPWARFDELWMHHIAKLTRQLINAEEAYESARAGAMRAGCNVSDSQASSLFHDDPSDGYSRGWEEICKATAPKHLIRKWLSGHSLPYDTIHEGLEAEAPDVDSFESADPNPWDSWSARAQPKAKMRIHRRRQACRNP